MAQRLAVCRAAAPPGAAKIGHSNSTVSPLFSLSSIPSVSATTALLCGTFSGPSYPCYIVVKHPFYHAVRFFFKIGRNGVMNVSIIIKSVTELKV